MTRNTLLPLLLLAIAAAASHPSAHAAEPKTLLIYSRCFGFRHKDAIEKGNPILKHIAEGLGYQAVISEDPAAFEPDRVGQWDVIVFNNATGRLNPPEEERRKALMARIQDGGAGFMGFHAATDCNYNWPEYGEMINGYFAGHPWNQEVRTTVEDPDHPLMKPFKGGPFGIKDEIYQFRNYQRSAVRVLMSIDTRSVPVQRGNRKDRDYAICWIRTWGKGRVYYNAHGHGANVFEDETFQQHIRLAMRWAAGDLEVDTTPSKPIDREALAAEAVKTLRSATTDQKRLEALDTLSWCPRRDALDLVLAQFDVNQQVAAVAADAAQAIVAKADDLPKQRKVDILMRALPLATGRQVRRSIRDQLKALGVSDIPVHVPPGYLAHWFVAGPLPNPQPHKNFDTPFPPEKGVDLAAGFAAEGKDHAWKKVEADMDGVVNLNEALRRASNVLAYLYAEVTVEQATPVELRVGSDDGVVLWLNGQRVLARNVNRALKPEADKVKAELHKGANPLLLKVTQGGGDWAACLRIVAPDGGKVDFEERKTK